MEHIHYETKETLQDRQRRKGNPMLWKLLLIWIAPLAIAMVISYYLSFLCKRFIPSTQKTPPSTVISKASKRR